MLIYRALLLTIAVVLGGVKCEEQQIFNISEEAPVGRVIGYVNGTPSDGIKPNFYIVYPDNSGETEKYLAVEEVSGEIRLLRELDYERHPTYQLLAVPVDGRAHGHAIHVIVNVIDENDNAPTFPVSSVDVAISEFAALNSEISLPPATDNDSPPLSVIKYHIVSGNVNNAFKLSSKRINSMLYVDLIVNGQLDREYRDRYELLIEAIDGGDPPRSGTMLVNVTVLDANDNAPEFSQSRYNATVPWNASLDYEVTTIHAVDPDLGENAHVVYSIAKNRADMKLPFKIDGETGIVRVADSNLLVSGSIYEFLIVASDHGLPQPLESTAFLTVVVQKNNQPKLDFDIFWLTDSGKPEVYENVTVGHVIARIAVQNAPEGSILSVSGCDSLCVKETDSPGVYLTLACGPLDREQKSEYNLLFTMKSVEKRLLEIPVFFEVLDVNDNAPKFGKPLIRVKFNRSLEQYELVRIQATDKDSGENARIHYSLWGTDLFDIEPDTGILNIRDSFDCSLEEHRFHVRAEDSGIPVLSSAVDVIAQIVDGNGRPPIFAKPLYDVTVKENAEPGTCLLKVKANNSCGSEGRVRYSLSKSGSVKELFHMDDQTGTICLDSTLDYEQSTVYQLHVYAHDTNGQSSRALVNVHVEDVNDNAPVFYPEQYNVSVRQNAAIGSPLILLSANDADGGIFGKVRYQFASGETGDFRLDHSSGRLYIQHKLSRKSYELRVEAVDGGGVVSEKQAVVHIIVISTSTPTPQFTSTLYKFSVSEETLPGIAIGEVRAEGLHPVSYSIYSGDPDHLFAIDARTGKLSVAQYLDADKWDELLLNVQAWMEGDGANHTQVLIKLLDSNDNDPTFEMDKVEAYVHEDHATHKPFFVVQASDKDRGKNGELTYALLQSEPPCPISVRPLSGELTLTANLDFELISKYYLVIQARDQGMPPRSSNITVVLNVLDVNDNKPEFDAEMYNAEIPEDIPFMADILTIRAKDQDSGQNARISYHLSEENHDFGIHAASGNVFVKSALDRETVAEYRLHVIATDHGRPEQSSQATVHIKILDINDNSPSCPATASFMVTDDGDTSGVFGKVVATDPDEGLNGSLIYRLQVEDVNFAIRSNGELMLKKKLTEKDYKKETRLSVIVLDREGGAQARSTVCPVRVIVGKAHSKVRFLEPMDRTIRISEKCTSGCLLKILNATDVAKWEIEMSDISSNFEIWNNTLRTSAYFNEATIADSRTLSVTAFDMDGRKKQITFTIRTANTLMPIRGDRTIVVKTSRSTPVGSPLMTISKERSSGSVWRLQNETDAFYLDGATSTLYLTTNFRRTRDTSYLLKVQELMPPDYHHIEQHNVYVEVEPANIHWPRFSDCPRFFIVKENEPTGSVIGKVTAEDADEGISGQLSYSIVQGPLGLFSIDPDTAEILLTRPLHWEQGLSLFMVVEAEDNYPDSAKRKRSRCVVFVEVEDINDHAPRFLSSNNVTIDDAFVDGDVIHYVVAADDDGGDNAKMTYALIDGNIDNAFSIDPNTGAVVLSHRFNGERSIRVRASDGGEPPKYAEKNIVIRFDSGRRQWKFFQQSKYFINLNSSAVAGTVLHDFFANRSDRPQVELFSYFVSEDEMLQLTDNGKLVLLEELTSGKHIYFVIATKGEEGLIDWASIELSVTGGNQYPPRIASSSCGNLTICENVAAERLARIYAQDQDEGADGEIFYKIVAGNENSVFYLNSSTGLLSCRELDRERQSQYFLVLTAEDQGVPKRADTCTLRITVTDENDNVPVFDDSVPEYIEIDDSTAIGEVLARLSAKDEDDGPSGKIVYSIVEDGSGLLDIRPDTGEIIFARDHPTSQHEYVVKVKAEDQGISRVLASERDFQLHLKRTKTEWEFTEPQFLSEHYSGFINEGEPRGQFVLQVHSSDPLTEDSPLAYSIVSGNVDAAFDIDNEGRITTAQELDYEIANAYSLKVIGTGNFKNTPETDVRIRVINTNDNIPSFPPLKPRKVPESASYGTLIATVAATDVDVDTQLEYTLLSPNDLFEMDPFSGKIFLIGKLDYETKKEHALDVQVTDGENTSRAVLLVIVEDVNDNAPKFEEEFYSVTLPKDAEIGSIIVKLRAHDPDSGAAGTIRYALAKNNSKFRIDPEAGELSISAKLEDRSTHYVKVHAFDQGKPSLSSAVVVRVSAGGDDYSRKPVRFAKKAFSFTIPEDKHSYIEFGKVALTEDVPSDVILRIQDVELASIFGISRDGSMFLKRSVDSDFKNEYEFVVEALSPHATYNASVKVHVKVTDVNDNVPYFTDKINELTVSERMNTNDVIARFAATDSDSGDNGRISYQILSGNDYEMFSLNSSSGILYFEKSVDGQQEQLNGTFGDLLIAAIDGGTPVRWNWTAVRVRFDADASSATAPFFIVSQYEINVFEDLPTGSTVLRSKAVNKLGLSGDDWIYTLADNDESFTCNKSTGHIMLMRNLDFEAQTQYEFTLGVKDGQDRSATVPVRIRVLGVDEYPPVFMKSNYVFQIPRSSQVGQLIGVVTATDQDAGADGEVRYEMEGNATRYLSIDPSTGQIALSRELDHRTSTNVTFDEFAIVASSSMRQSARTKVIVQIGDFSPLDVFTSTGSLTATQILTIGSLALLFILLVTLIVLVIHMRIRSRTKPKKQVYSVSRGNIAVVSDLNRRSPDFEREKQLVLLPSSPATRYKSSSSSSGTHVSNVSSRLLPKPPLEMGNNSGSHSMPDSGIDPDDMSVTSSVTDYLNQIGVTPNKYFDSKDGSSRERFTGYRNDMHNDPEISDLIYAKVDEILSPASRMNVSFTSNSSINISSFTAKAVSPGPAPTFRPLSELLMDMRKQRHNN